MIFFESKGYTSNANGYYEKDGKELALDIATHEAFIEKQRIAAVLVEQFQKVGINASTCNEPDTTWNENRRMGNFDAQMNWEMCFSVNEPWKLDLLIYPLVVPERERAQQYPAPAGLGRSRERSKMSTKWVHLPLGDPRIHD